MLRITDIDPFYLEAFGILIDFHVDIIAPSYNLDQPCRANTIRFLIYRTNRMTTEFISFRSSWSVDCASLLFTILSTNQNNCCSERAFHIFLFAHKQWFTRSWPRSNLCMSFDVLTKSTFSLTQQKAISIGSTFVKKICCEKNTFFSWWYYSKRVYLRKYVGWLLMHRKYYLTRTWTDAYCAFDNLFFVDNETKYVIESLT